MSLDWRYIAKYGLPRGHVEPHGLYRTRQLEDVDRDEALTRDGSWKPTKGLVPWHWSREEHDYIEVTEEAAKRLAAEILARPPRPDFEYYRPETGAQSYAETHQESQRFALADAIDLARGAHEGQLDKAGRPYIEHPLRVMLDVEGEQARMAAVLHDVLEDTDVTVQDLRSAGCPQEVVEAVIALTKLPGESLSDSLARVTANPIARIVKCADLADNGDPERLAMLDPETADRLRGKYAESLRLLDSEKRARETGSG